MNPFHCQSLQLPNGYHPLNKEIYDDEKIAVVASMIGKREDEILKTWKDLEYLFHLPDMMMRLVMNNYLDCNKDDRMKNGEHHLNQDSTMNKMNFYDEIHCHRRHFHHR